MSSVRGFSIWGERDFPYWVNLRRFVAEKVSGLAIGIFRTIEATYLTLQRAWEVLPGPLGVNLGSYVQRENQTFTLLAPFIEQTENGASEILADWTLEELGNIQNFVGQLRGSSKALRRFAYGENASAFFFLKGALRQADPESLEKKLDALETAMRDNRRAKIEERLTPADCGALECASRWCTLLERLQDRGIENLDPLIAQWRRFATAGQRPFMEELKRRSADWLSKQPASLFLAGKAEWNASHLHSDLSSGMPLMDMGRYTLMGDGTHTGFFAKTAEGNVMVSHHITSHKLHPSTTFLSGIPACLFLDVSIRPLLSSTLGQETLERIFLETLREQALVQRNLSQTSLLWGLFSHIFGLTSYVSRENFALQKTELCSSYTAKILMHAWEVTNRASLEITSSGLNPLFEAHDAVSRITISQLLERLKDRGLLTLSKGDEVLDSFFERDRLLAYWERL